jgi:DNA polymerase III alpha subunit
MDFLGLRNLTVLEDVVTIRSALTEENKAAIAALAQQLA